ncbi:unnamed protein product [Pleuronectes platessa]|uniref:Uncharacterized protein n=1 Tax=Pleuronectes platessa TaxID=8262 RepID=A0A9N7YH22_PLEPL|nr:unnamed protein product [Pleuronectes platessa]
MAQHGVDTVDSWTTSHVNTDLLLLYHVRPQGDMEPPQALCSPHVKVPHPRIRRQIPASCLKELAQHRENVFSQVQNKFRSVDHTGALTFLNVKQEHSGYVHTEFQLRISNHL